MSATPTIKIKGRTYEYPTSSKLGDAALIERLTDLTHAEWRRRYRASLEAVLESDESVEEDSAISIGIVAMAVARANPRWSRTKVTEFVNDLDWDEVEFEAGEDDPLDSGAESAPTTEPTGTTPAEPSNSGSDTASSESTTPPTSGTPTWPMSHEEPSVRTI